jgi:hypothetical protein
LDDRCPLQHCGLRVSGVWYQERRRQQQQQQQQQNLHHTAPRYSGGRGDSQILRLKHPENKSIPDITSKNRSHIVTVELSFTISPDVKHSFLLSSRTVFIDSIQMASMGPGKI